MRSLHLHIYVCLLGTDEPFGPASAGLAGLELDPTRHGAIRLPCFSRPTIWRPPHGIRPPIQQPSIAPALPGSQPPIPGVDHRPAAMGSDSSFFFFSFYPLPILGLLLYYGTSQVSPQLEIAWKNED